MIRCSYLLREDIISTAKSMSCAKMGSCVVAVSAFAMLFVIAIISVFFNSLIDKETFLT